MKYQIIRIFKRVTIDGMVFASCFEIAGQFHGYTNLEDARSDKAHMEDPHNHIIIQVFE